MCCGVVWCGVVYGMTEWGEVLWCGLMLCGLERNCDACCVVLCVLCPAAWSGIGWDGMGLPRMRWGGNEWNTECDTKYRMLYYYGDTPARRLCSATTYQSSRTWRSNEDGT